jgi:hypothetical protein
MTRIRKQGISSIKRRKLFNGNLPPTTPGANMTITSMEKLPIRTFLLCYTIGHFNFALTAFGFGKKWKMECY